MVSRVLPYPLFDADNHLYETEESLTKYLPKEYAGAIQYVQVNGRTKIAIRGQISDYIPNPTFEVVARPGAMEEYFKIGNPEGKSRREIFGEPMRSVPAYREPGPRLELMDELGVDRTLMFPTLASLVEERMRDDPELIHVVVHSLNQWLHEVWGFNYKDRIFTTPVISLPIVDKAIAELEWCLERGAKAILVRPAPVPGFLGPRSFALPEFDPFWKKAEQAGVLVAMHSSDSGYARYTSEWEGGRTEMLPFKPNAFRMIGEWRPVSDAVASWVCHGALYRFPELKVAVIENGSAWLEPLLETLADIYKKMPQEFPGDPVEMVKNRIHVSPFYEEDLGHLTNLIGVERVLFGSDYPHPEGLAHPTTFVDALKGLDEEEKAKVMGGNLARLMGM
ncbi:amidohydrolase [Amycolatopsis sp. K13G38]|uniref:Amidohydrolase n=1 Tax=Amycolatopsis acididurans TaxID=2724524 RepID=A0ABX1IVM5_9PSEU|nr:amidohydrolase family protein [Amycolatopsis acididurans]NKQ51542.1 amidohydrolase [Amycolatopsis acididurans]